MEMYPITLLSIDDNNVLKQTKTSDIAQKSLRENPKAIRDSLEALSNQNIILVDKVQIKSMEDALRLAGYSDIIETSSFPQVKSPAQQITNYEKSIRTSR